MTHLSTITKLNIIPLGLDLQVSSAGLSNPRYEFMSEYMTRTLARLGYTDLNWHTPRRVDPNLLLEQDLIICFENYQAEVVNRMLQGNNPRVYTLPAFAGDATEIANPQARIKDDLLSAVEAVHDDLAKKIEKYVVKALDRIASESGT